MHLYGHWHVEVAMQLLSDVTAALCLKTANYCVYFCFAFVLNHTFAKANIFFLPVSTSWTIRISFYVSLMH